MAFARLEERLGDVAECEARAAQLVPILQKGKQMLRCGWCGPLSLRVNAERKVKFECATGLAGFEFHEVTKYVKMDCCGTKVSYECLDRIAAFLAEQDWDLVHDPQGIWKALKIKAYRGAVDVPGVFFAAKPGRSARFINCINCEDVDLPASKDSWREKTLLELKKMPVDMDKPVTLVVEFTSKNADGTDGPTVCAAALQAQARTRPQ